MKHPHHSACQKKRPNGAGEGVWGEKKGKSINRNSCNPNPPPIRRMPNAEVPECQRERKDLGKMSNVETRTTPNW